MIMFPDGGGRSMLRGTGLPMQPLQDLWLIPARKEVAKAALQQAVVRVADRAVATAAEVKKVYARLQYTQRAVELVRDNMHVVEQSTESIRARQSAGQATQVDLNIARIRRLKLQSELIEMQAEHRRNQRELLMLMGVAGATDGWQVSSVAELSDPVNAIDDEAGLVTLAANQRLDVKAAQWQTEAAAANVKLMHREALPEMALGLTLERSPAPRSNNPKWAGQAGNIAARGLVDRAAGMPSGPMLPAPFSPKMREVEYTIGPMLELELPLFDQGQGRIGKAYYEYRQRFVEYEAKLQETIRMVREGLIMYGEAREQLEFYRTAIMPEVERNLALAQQSFVAGRESLTNLLETQEELIMTRLKMLAFYRDCCVQRAELERQVGGKLGTLSSAATTQPAIQP
jgi:cobalt-zinc-cadmium efflux system outer membrane protein